MTNLDSILKNRDITLLTKGSSTESYGFSISHVWMWELDYKESWMLKNWCFWTVVLEKTLESPLTARRSNQSILKEISPGCSLEGLMVKLKLQYFGHLTQRTDSLEETPMLGKIEGGRRRGWQDKMVRWHYWLDGHAFEQALGVVMDREAWHAAVYGVAESDTTEQLNWTERLNCKVVCCCLVPKSYPTLLRPHGV